MKRVMTLVVTAAFALALSTSVLLAQQPPHQHDAAKQPPAPSATPGTPAPAMEAHMAKHMEMCRHMMGYGGMMGGGMGSGMMGGGDPKQQAEMMAMRGEMMKAMGEIMMKYAQRMQSTK